MTAALHLEGPPMPSESNGSRPEVPDAPPPSGPTRRQSGRAPSAWGAVRDALASVRNLESLLRGATVSNPTILELVPELRASAGVLVGAFEAGPGGEAAAGAVRAFGAARVADFGRLLDDVAAAGEDRTALADRARWLADELEAAADLLAILERASDPIRTEVSLGLVVRETSRLSGSASGREVEVRFEDASRDCVATTDPYVIGSLLLAAVAWVRQGGDAAVVVRARCSPPFATLLVERARPGDESLPIVAMRVLPHTAPAETAVRRVAEQIGARLDLRPEACEIRLAAAAAV